MLEISDYHIDYRTDYHIEYYILKVIKCKKEMWLLTQDIGGNEDAMTGGAHQEVEDDEEEVVGDEGHSHGRRHLQDGRDHQRLLTAYPVRNIKNVSQNDHVSIIVAAITYFTNSRRRYMAEILPIRRKTLSNQSINQS